MNKKLALIIITIAMALTSACNSINVKVVLPHNKCEVAACHTTDKGHIYVNGQEITK